MIPEAMKNLPRRHTAVGPGHFAAVVYHDVAVTTDGVGTKIRLAEALDDFSTIGIDAVAMNVNDLLCVGADPGVFVDYIVAPDEATAERIAEGVAKGSEIAGVDVPGGETAIMPGLDVAGTALGRIGMRGPILGQDIEPGDLLIGLPSSGIHANGMTAARKCLGDDPRLLPPTEIYVPAIRALWEETSQVVGLANITGDGWANIDRLGHHHYKIDDPFPIPPLFQELLDHPQGGSTDWNLGLGFVIIVPPEHGEKALATLRGFYPTTKVIGGVYG